ncbi:MAG: SusD/RagB family nutrient-binding outer membrane lipoprotein, partial [Flavobacterium sp.]
MQRTIGTATTYSYYRGIAMIMNAFVFQRIVDLYGSAPYTTALATNAQFSYPYDSGSTIYSKSIAKIDSAVTIINTALNATPNTA